MVNFYWGAEGTVFVVPPFHNFPLILHPNPLCRHVSDKFHSQLLKREIQPERANFTSLLLKFQDDLKEMQIPHQTAANVGYLLTWISGG